MKCLNVACFSVNDKFNEQPGLSHPDQVAMVFGPRILQYSNNLCQGHYDYIARLPNALLFTIMAYLDLEDISGLSRTCRKFREVSPVVISKVSLSQTKCH